MALLRKMSAIRGLHTKSKHIAMILSGSGVYDGSEIQETTSMLIHLSKHNVKVSAFSPDQKQMHTINHVDGSVMDSERNMLIESARIVRGNIQPLKDLSVSNFDGLLLPGGFGIAKNLSNFVEASANCTVLTDVDAVLKEFNSNKKPIGLSCIAPILAARCLPGVEITLGQEDEQNGLWPFASACQAAKQMGAKHVPVNPTDIHIDKRHKIITTPAYMYSNATLYEVFTSIGKLIEALLRL